MKKLVKILNLNYIKPKAVYIMNRKTFKTIATANCDKIKCKDCPTKIREKCTFRTLNN